MKLIYTILLAMCCTLSVAQSNLMMQDPQSWGVIDSTGKFVVDDWCRAKLEFHNNISYAATNDIWGLIDRRGNVIRPFKYSDIRYVDNGGWMLNESNSQYTFIDSALNIVMPPTIASGAVGIYFSNGILCVGIYGDGGYGYKYGYYKAGKVIVEPIYNYASPFNQGMAAVMDDNGDWRFINREGEFVGQVYNSATPFNYNNNKWWKVGLDNPPSKDGTPTQRYGVVDSLCQPVLVPVFGDIDIMGSLLKLRKGGRYALANSQLKLITPFEYDNFGIVTYSSGSVDYICTVQNGKFGLLTKQGDMLIKPIYDQLCYIFQSKMFYAKIGAKWGVIFHTGRTFIPFIYDDISTESSESLYLQKDKIWYCFTHKGKFLYQSNWPPYDYDLNY